MYSCQKPHQFLSREKDYNQHINRINKILKDHKMKECHWDRHIAFPKYNKHTLNYQHSRKIQEENQRLAHKIIDISRRKTSPSNLCRIPIHRPFRKMQQKKIDLQNSQLAERLISKQSEFSRVKMKKEMEQYQRVKRSLMKNRRPHLSYSSETTLDVASSLQL